RHPVTDFRVVAHPVPAPPNVVASLPEVLIPMLWWRGVPMRRAQPVSMTPLERFVLEMALRVGEAEPDEFFEITGLPGALLPVAARRLVGSKALQRRADAFTPCFPGAEHAFRTQTLYEERHTSFDVVLLPRTGDLIA